MCGGGGLVGGLLSGGGGKSSSNPLNLLTGSAGAASSKKAGKIQAKAAKEAAAIKKAAADAAIAQQKIATQQAIAQQQAAFGQIQQGFSPYTGAGGQAIGLQGNFLGLNGPAAEQQAFNNYAESPGQAFLREQGQKALLANASKIGGLGGGNVRDALVKQGIGYASQDYNNYMDRLAGLSAQGQQAAAGLGQLGMANAGNVGEYGMQGANLVGNYGLEGAGAQAGGLTGAAEARASGILGSTQARQQALNNMMQMGGQIAGAFSDERLKSNIEKIGELPSGINIYEYDIFGRHEIGVLAQEVIDVIPDAVSVHESGFYMVDYSRIH